MKLVRTPLLLLWLLAAWPLLSEAAFNDWFEDRTLRMDYIFAGDSVEQKISMDEMFSLPYWAGRRNHLDSLLLAGNGQILMNDAASGKLIYCQSFSTLFQEWQHTEEARRSYKSFENCFLLPYPKKTTKITVRLFDSYQHITSELTIPVDPKDIQIRKLDNKRTLPHKKLLDNGNTKDCIDIAVLAEGYCANQMDSFYCDVNKMEAELFNHEPFKTYKNRFNIIAVASASEDSGVSIPRKSVWKETALGSQFDTFYSDRYLTTLHLKKMQDLLTGIPYEYIIILVNSDVYGGGGIYNLYMLSTIHNKQSLPVCVHEFGHSFAGLADEYAYNDDTEPYYHPGVEPWEKNITTLADFNHKWADMLNRKTRIPTPENKKVKTDYQHVGVFEGAGYLTKGVYRPAQDCRMRVNNVPAFCPVCQRAIGEVIRYYTE
jgi:hypothetical protein